MTAKWYSGTWGPKVSWHLSYRWRKIPKTSPRKLVLKGDGSRARCVTGVHATASFTAVDHYLIYNTYEGYFFFHGSIGSEIRTTVRIRWSFARMCCAMSLVCPSIATHRICQFWARSEPVNMSKTIESPTKCGVCAVIRFLYSEQATRNIVIRHCSSSWQCSAAYCSCDKEAPEAFWMGRVWSPTIIRPDLAPCDFHLFPHMRGHRRTTFWQNELQTIVENWLKGQAAGF